MIETKPLKVKILTERMYNVNEVVADMKAMGGQVAEYALVMEKLCNIIKRQEKEFRALNECLVIAEEKMEIAGIAENIIGR